MITWSIMHQRGGETSGRKATTTTNSWKQQIQTFMSVWSVLMIHLIRQKITICSFTAKRLQAGEQPQMLIYEKETIMYAWSILMIHLTRQETTIVLYREATTGWRTIADTNLRKQQIETLFLHEAYWYTSQDGKLPAVFHLFLFSLCKRRSAEPSLR